MYRKTRSLTDHDKVIQIFYSKSLTDNDTMNLQICQTIIYLTYDDTQNQQFCLTIYDTQNQRVCLTHDDNQNHQVCFKTTLFNRSWHKN